MIQLNTPYPATAYLTGFLRLHEARLGLVVAQADPALELFLRLYSRAGLERVRAALAARPRRRSRSEASSAALANFGARIDEYIDSAGVAALTARRSPPG